MSRTRMTHRRTPALLVLPLLALGLWACTELPAVPVEEGLPLTASTGVLQSPLAEDSPLRRGIEEALSQWESAWNAMDPAAYANSYAVDADVVNPLGGVVPGRESIRQTHTFLFNGFFRGSTSRTEIRRIVFLTGETALVDVNVTLTGFQGTPPGLVQISPGVVLTRSRLVMNRRMGAWQILAQQMTAVQPAP